MGWKSQVRTAGGRFGGLSDRALRSRAKFEVKIDAKIQAEFDKVAEKVKRETIYSLKGAAYALMMTARAHVIRTRKPGPAGKPARTRGKVPSLKRAIIYAVDRKREEAYIGPQAGTISTIGSVHEFGKRYKKSAYPPRPFMKPAFEKVRPLIPEKFRGILS